MTLIGQNFWPPDELYADEEIREQWYLTGDWAPEGVNEDVHINWTPVAEDLEQRGHDNVVLGIIDDGIAWDAEDGLLHPDLQTASHRLRRHQTRRSRYKQQHITSPRPESPYRHHVSQ